MAKRKDKEDLQYDFTGEWLPAIDAAIVGPKNFTKLQNMRYSEGSVETVLGYSYITQNGIPGRPNNIIRDAIQLTAQQGQYSYIFVVNSLGTGQYVHQLDEEPPTTGEFNDPQISYFNVPDASTRFVGRLGNAVNGHITYCNEITNAIYGGEERRAAAVFQNDLRVFDAISQGLSVDVTYKVNNSLDDDANIITIVGDTGGGGTGNLSTVAVFSPRAIDAVYFEVKTPNTLASTVRVYVWGGAVFNEFISGITDGTSVGGVSLAQSGWIEIPWYDTDNDLCDPMFFQGLYFYAYTFNFSAGTAEVSEIKLRIPFQKSIDLWDGVYRQPIQCQYYDADVTTPKYQDFTLAVNTPSDAGFPIGLELDAMKASGDGAYVIFMFEEKMVSITFNMIEGLVNTNGVGGDRIILRWWDGETWNLATGFDGTAADNAKPLGQSGTYTWDLTTTLGKETPQELFGQTGYAYQMTTTVALSGAVGGDPEVVVDTIYGVPAPKIVPPYSFSTLHRNRTFYFDYAAGHENNRSDYTMTNAADVFNGLDSSDDGLQSLYYGGSEKLTGAASIYNRFGSNILSLLVVFKNTETYVLAGDSPEDFKIFPVSKSIGCPCPMSIETAEVGFSMTEEIERNIVLWMSYSGPMIFDGAVMRRIKGVENFFDTAKSECINYDYMWKSVGWFDDTYKEYNFCFPSGSAATENNKWIVYDLVKQKWYERVLEVDDLQTESYPSSKLRCNSMNGARYTYVALTDGDLQRMNDGPNHGGDAIVGYVEPGDFWPSGSIWHETRLRYLKAIAKIIPENIDLDIFYFKDTSNVAGADVLPGDWVDSLTVTEISHQDWSDVVFYDGVFAKLPLTGSVDRRLTKVTKAMNELAYIHRFGFRVISDTTERAFLPIAWGVKYEIQRDDLKES